MQKIRKGVTVDYYVIMPNHVQMMVVIDGDGRTPCAPTVSRIIKHWKEAVTKRIGFSPWQRSFYDHVVRGEKDYLRVAEYIGNNPLEWALDEYYVVDEPA